MPIPMLVADVQASIRFYQALGFYVAATEMDGTGTPLWALLRRDDADLFLQSRAAWPAHLVPIHPAPAPLRLVLGGDAAGAHTDPDGTHVVTGQPQRRAA